MNIEHLFLPFVVVVVTSQVRFFYTVLTYQNRFSHAVFCFKKKKSHLGLCKDKALNPSSSSYLLYNIGKSPSEPRFEQTRKTNYYF